MELSYLSFGGKTYTRLERKPLLDMKGSCLTAWCNMCPYDILPLETKRVANLQALLCDLENGGHVRVVVVESEKKRLKEKLIGLKYLIWRIARLL
jgi:hypothetical protein